MPFLILSAGLSTEGLMQLSAGMLNAVMTLWGPHHFLSLRDWACSGVGCVPMLQPCRSIASCSGKLSVPLQFNGLPAQEMLPMEGLLTLGGSLQEP